MADLVCSLCRSPAEKVAVSFVKRTEGKPAKLWRLELPVCTNDKCLEARGATWTEHRENRSGHG